MELRPRTVEVSLSGLPGARLWTDGGARETAGQSLRLPLAPDSVTSAKLFVVAPGDGPARQDFPLALRALDDDPRGAREPNPVDRPGTTARPTPTSAHPPRDPQAGTPRQKQKT